MGNDPRHPSRSQGTHVQVSMFGAEPPRARSAAAPAHPATPDSAQGVRQAVPSAEEPWGWGWVVAIETGGGSR